MSRREVEVKFRLGAELDAATLSQRLSERGFRFETTRTEFDFVPDTPGYRCRAHKLIVRFRRVTTHDDTRVLLTFKQKLQNGRFLDAQETEFFLDAPDRAAWSTVNKVLQEKVGVRLPESLLGSRDLLSIVRLAAGSGLSQFRMMIEKKRSVFKRDDIVATIDELPGGIGTFLELEAHDEDALAQAMAYLDLPKPPNGKLDYGDIIMAHNGSDDRRGRTAVFDHEMRQAIYDVVEWEGK